MDRRFPPGQMLWRRLDLPGHESVRLSSQHGLHRLVGTSVFAYRSQACRLSYEVVCTMEWHTTSGSVAGWIGEKIVQVDFVVDEGRRWRLNGEECPEVAGCIDVDLNFSPSTNLLPIRRLNLAVGQEARVRAAWLHFPSLALEPLDQLYRRTGAVTYRYESPPGTLVGELTVNRLGFIVNYPGFFEAEPTFLIDSSPAV